MRNNDYIEAEPELELAGYRLASHFDGARCCGTCKLCVPRDGVPRCAHCYMDEVQGHCICDYYEYNPELGWDIYQKAQAARMIQES